MQASIGSNDFDPPSLAACRAGCCLRCLVLRGLPPCGREAALKLLAAILALVGAACTLGALRLFVATYRFFASADYQPGVRSFFSYGVGLGNVDGGGIFLPSFLLLALALFLGRFAVNLWRGASADEARLRALESNARSSSGKDAAP